MAQGDTKSMPRPVEAPAAAQPRRAPASPALAREGTRLGRYELLLALARGGMAEVWIARQRGELGFERIVAVKTIRPDLADDLSFRRMFLDEARLAARIRHANVVEVLDLGEEAGLVFQAMTLIEGDSVTGLLRRWHRAGHAGGFSPALAARLVADAAAGLHAAHELTDDDGAPMHLVHRDVSPQNILVGVEGVAKISDFGIAKALGRLADETEVGQVKGKFGYLSPEQVARRQPDRRSDVFAAGIVLWEVLTGGRLFRGNDAVETLAHVATLAVPDPRTLAPGIPAGIAEAAMRALARDPDARFPTAAAFAEALEGAAKQAGAVAVAKDVAALVLELVGADLEQQRTAIREATRSSMRRGAPSRRAETPPAVAQTVGDPSTHASVATTVARAEPSPARGRSRGAFMIGGGLLLGGSLALSLALGRAERGRAAAEPTEAATPPPVTTMVLLGPDPDARDAGDTPPPAASASTAATATAIASAPASSAPRPARRPAIHAAPQKPRPKFSSPYGP